MPELSGLTDYFDPGLVLKGVPDINKVEHSYAIPLASAELGLWCRLVAQTTGTINDESSEEELKEAAAAIEALPDLPGGKHLTLSQRVLGSAYDQMVADKVPDAVVEYCGMTVYFYILGGEQAASRWWRSGGRPEAPRPGNRAQKRAAKKATGGSRTAAATGTRKPASTSGTKSPRKSAKSAAAKA